MSFPLESDVRKKIERLEIISTASSVIPPSISHTIVSRVLYKKCGLTCAWISCSSVRCCISFSCRTFSRSPLIRCAILLIPCSSSSISTISALTGRTSKFPRPTFFTLSSISVTGRMIPPVRRNDLRIRIPSVASSNTAIPDIRILTLCVRLVSTCTRYMDSL